MATTTPSRPHKLLIAEPIPGGVERAPFPFCITPEACDRLVATVGDRMPEAGAKLFGPHDRMGIDTVEFDERGSAAASRAAYSPDVEWGERVRAYWLSQPDDRIKLWTGDAHSHPGGIGHPSSKSGQGLGDLGYVEEVFDQNESMQWYAMPILTNVGRHDRPVSIWPWVVERGALRPRWAELRVCQADEFPARIFPEDWLAWAEAPREQAAVAVDLARLGDLLGVPVHDAGLPRLSRAIELRLQSAGGREVVLVLDLPAEFPRRRPTVFVRDEAAELQSVYIRWRSAPVPVAPERRLAALCGRVVDLMDCAF